MLAFTSSATNLAPDEGHSADNVYLRDLETGATSLISTHRPCANPDGCVAGPSAAPAVSGDGAFVAFVSWARDLDAVHPLTANPYENRDEEVSQNVANPTQVRRLTSRGGASNPAWSPDGRTIAFAGPGGLYRVNANGSPQPKMLLRAATYPAWSPTGDRIAFSLPNASGRGLELYTATPDGTQLTRVTTEPGTAKDIEPAWSPDGRAIAYVKVSEQPDKTLVDHGIWAALADGTRAPLLLTDDPGAFDAAPTWRPDGGLIAFSSTRSPDTDVDLFTFELGSGALRRLTVNPLGDSGATNAPDFGPLRVGPATPAMRSVEGGALSAAYAVATVQGDPARPAPTGTVTFFLCPPDPSTAIAPAARGAGPPPACASGGRLAGRSSLVATGPGASTAGSPRTSSTTPPIALDVPGAWCWRTEYSGDRSYHPSQTTAPTSLQACPGRL